MSEFWNTFNCFVMMRLVITKSGDSICNFSGRLIVNDTLTQRYGACIGKNQVSNNRNDWSLNSVDTIRDSFQRLYLFRIYIVTYFAHY